MSSITKVIFLEPQPSPDGKGTQKTTYDLTQPGHTGWSAYVEDGFFVLEDAAGHAIEVPVGRVLRVWRNA